MSSVLTVHDVAFEFPNGHAIFTDLNFSLNVGLSALVGPNGVGKSTLARLLVGELKPSAGTIRRRASVAFFAQREVAPEVTIAEYLGVGEWSVLRERLLGEIALEARCSHLSGGEWMRVRLVRRLDDSFLILDEPTNDLDREGRAALLAFLRERPGGALLISHDREALSLCSDVLELSNQGLAKFGGGWEAYEAEKAGERERLGEALEGTRRARDQARADRSERVARQEKRNRRGAAAAARGGMPKILIGGRKRRAQVTSGRVDRETLARADETVSEAYSAFQAQKLDPVMYADLVGREVPAQRLVAEARAFNIHFGSRWLYGVEGLSFAWRGSLRLALRGANGSGKSSLLKALLGAAFETRGELRRGDLKTLYLDQRCASLDDEKSIFENVRDVCRADESEIRGGLAKFLFAGETVFQKVGSLSGGERLRAALACGLLSTEKPELLILDEPTNNLDLTNIEFLERLVGGFKGALIVISHDEVFLQNCGVNESFQLL